MIYRPNSAAVIPADGDWDEGFGIERAVAHPVLLHAPSRFIEPASRVLIDRPFYDPPPSVLAAFYAKTWDVVIDVTGPGGALAVSASVAALRSSWGEVLAAGQSWSFDSETSASAPTDFTNVSIGQRSGAANFNWNDNPGWWTGVSLLLSSTAWGVYPDPLVSVQMTATKSLGDIDAEVVFTFAGNIIPLYYTDAGDAGSVSGTITATPSEWLDVV